MQRSFRIGVRILVLCLTLASAYTVAAQEPDGRFDGMQARSIGPAGMSGRIAAIDAVIDDPDTIYVGAATGGLWKTTNGGTTWEPIFDDQPVHAIGALAIFQASPDVVWVGTGEGNVRNSVSGIGNGVYRSLDGGRTWSHLGLEATERIHRIVLHPTDPDIAYVAALGEMWGENADRGVYKTIDGGATWSKILYVDPTVGASDLDMDPRNPNKLFATLWEYRRWPFFFNSGGAGSGLYVTYDGGQTWTRRTESDGMPEGNLGRIGVAISRSDPEIVYALVEATKSALLRSTDGGVTFDTVNDDNGVSGRPFYYSGIEVDPQRPDRIYRVNSRITVSDDGGATFGPAGSGVHPDHHAFWIHPHDPTFILDGNDGGVAISRDRGATWHFVRNLPLAQFYHVAVDMEVPYNVYGGLQDNGSWRGPSALRTAGGFSGGGIGNERWTMVSFGDGFDTRASQGDASVGYSMSQGGNLVRWNLETGETRTLKPDGPDDVELRFNWNAALALDPFDPDTIYYGSQFVHRSPDRGETWDIISDDLTTDEEEWQQQATSGGLTFDVTGAENYTTIVALAPSTVQQGVLWAGSDDGRLHVTRDGGDTWVSLEGNLPGVPANTWIPHIEPSPHAAGTAFVVLDDHRRSNDEPYAYRTDDFGASWTSLVTDNIRGYALSIVQDPVEPDLLFLGTELGLYVSFDGGNAWMQWTAGLPTASYMDMVIHPREHDLVLGTHGRSIYILDDVRPLREIAAGALDAAVHLFEIPEAHQHARDLATGELFAGNAVFNGTNRDYGAMITFALNDDELPTHADEPVASGGGGGGFFGFGGGGGGAPQGPRVTVEILDGDGETVRTLRVPARQGINRTTWNLRMDPFVEPQGGGGGAGFGGGGGQGPEVLPGTYTVRVSHGDEQAEGQLVVHADPDSPFTPEQRRAKWTLMREAAEMQRLAGDAVQRIRETRDEVQEVLSRARPSGGRPGAAGAGPGAGPRRGQGGPQARRAATAARDDDAGDAAENAGGERGELMRAGRALVEQLDEIEKAWTNPQNTNGITASDHITSSVRTAAGRLNSTWGPAGEADMTYLRQARAELEAGVESLNALFSGDVAAFRQMVRDAAIELLPEQEPLRMPGQER